MWPTKRTLMIVAVALPLGLPAATLSAFFLWPYLALWIAGLLLFLVDAMLLPRAGSIHVSSRVPAAVPIGDPQPARFGLRLRAAPRRAEVKLDLSENLTPQAARTAMIGPEAQPVAIPLVPIRRGEAQIETLWVRYAGPLGLLERVVAIPVRKSLVITVNFSAVRRMAVTALRMQEFRVGPRIERFLGEGTEFDSLGEYARGIDTRRIDWKATARHRKLLVRQYRAERNQHVVLALDTGRLMAEPIGGLPRLDYAIEAALLLGYTSLRSADQVSAFAFDAEVKTSTKPFKGVGAMNVFLEMFSRLSYSTAETNFTYGLTALANALPRRALVVVFTDFVDSVTAELMCDNLLRLSDRHLVVFVATRDVDVEATAKAAPRDAVALNRAVVAGNLLQERELVFRRLRRRGISCVDAPPGPLSLELVRRYLSIKRREMI